MEKLLVLLVVTAVLFTCTTTRVQLPEGETVPERVLNGFNQLHAATTNQQWSILPDGKYSVRYRITGFRYRDVLDSRGELVHTQQEARPGIFPKEVEALIYREYPNYKVGEASKLTIPDGEQVWDIGLEGPEDASFVLRVKRDGTVISQTETEDYKWFM